MADFIESTSSPINGLNVFISFHSRNTGVFYSLFSEEEYAFSDLGQLVLLLNQLCDTIGFPQANQRLRGNVGEEKTDFFLDEEASLPPKTTEQEIWHKCIGTKIIVVRIICRHYASMQGVVYCTQKKDFFRSALELISILQREIGDNPLLLGRE